MKVKLKGTNGSRVVLQEVVEHNDKMYTLLLCSYPGGYLLSIPDLNLCCPVSDDCDVTYNNIVSSGCTSELAREIADHIRPYTVF